MPKSTKKSSPAGPKNGASKANRQKSDPTDEDGARAEGEETSDGEAIDVEAVEAELVDVDEDDEEEDSDSDSDSDASEDDPDADEDGPTGESDDDDVAAAGVAERALARGPGASLARSGDPMAVYMREVQRHPLLTPEQVHELAVKFLETQDPKIAARLVTSNLRLVVKIAYEYRRAYKNMMDLVQEGNIGLMQAVKRYDPYRGVRLSSYSAFWIRAYILRFILNNWRLVKLGTTQAQRKLFFNLKKKRAELEAMGIAPTDAEIAKQLNVPENDVREMAIRLDSNENSLDAPVGDGEGRSVTRGDMIAEEGASPEVLAGDSEIQDMLQARLAEFRLTLLSKEKELAIFDERLVADDPLTLQDLGTRFGISRERVRQLEQRVMTRLREYLQETMGDAAHVRAQ